MDGYEKFIEGKQHAESDGGFEPLSLPDVMFDFQKSLCDWALRKGRAAVFADCGLGKTLIQLVWADNVVRKTNRPVLIITPLAVSRQTVAEANKFDIEATRTSDGKCASPKIWVTNYERLHYFNSEDFSGVVCDESSILKSFDGATRKALTKFMLKVPYRLLCTATAAPNDYTELGTSSEALGYMGHVDMLTRFFKNDNNSVKPFTFALDGRYDGGGWRFKGHAEQSFWRWVCSWSRSMRKPSDMGFCDDRFELPPLIQNQHVVKANELPFGMLFNLPAVGLKEQRAERRRTLGQRCEKVAELLSNSEPGIAWCHLNDEGDEITKMVDGAVQVSGADSDEEKEENFLAFMSGEARVLVTKPSIGAWGLNFQHCNRMTFFPSHSYEQFYQGIRRCWRFGQTRQVTVDIVTSDGESNVMANLQRKSDAADRMFTNLVAQMNKATAISSKMNFNNNGEVPSWM